MNGKIPSNTRFIWERGGGGGRKKLGTPDWSMHKLHDNIITSWSSIAFIDAELNTLMHWYHLQNHIP